MEFDEQQQQYRIPGMNFLPPTNFTPEEALSLLVLCYNLGDRSGIPFHTPARAAALKLESALPERIREYLRETASAIHLRLQAASRSSTAAPIYQQLIDAIARRRCVRIEYDSFSDREVLRTRLSPYRLLFSRRSWYVFGRSSLHRQTRTFNVARIRRLELLDDRFSFPRGFTIERQLRNAWHLIPEPGPDQEIVVRFEKLVAKNVAEVAWHKTQQLHWLEDGRLDFHVTVSGIQEISWWILGYGDQAEVLRPLALRELVACRCRQMLLRYQPSTAIPADPTSIQPAGRAARGKSDGSTNDMKPAGRSVSKDRRRARQAATQAKNVTTRPANNRAKRGASGRGP
jgi:predicted DNA-binding transcriptional regulator YafY